ncbi:MAG: hypothetical protein WCS37_17455 [Chloroflexota bacterium]|nr:hypothetical protein [Chloroflexota bacterium]
MRTLLALTKDLFFFGKINAAVQNLGDPSGEWRSIIVHSAEAFRARLTEENLALVLIDLTARQAEPEALIRAARELGLPVLAFGSHTDPQSLRQARLAGAYRSVPNSVLVSKFPALIAQAFDPTKAPPRGEDEPD